MSRDLNERPPLIETVPISDIFASELGRIEKIGPCARLVFAVTQAGVYDDGSVGQERVVVARIVLPARRATVRARGATGPCGSPQP